MESRESREMAVKTYAHAVTLVDINPINTHLGKVTMLDRDAYLIEEIGKDWCVIGQIQDLTDEEFNSLYSAVQDNAKNLLTHFASS